MKIKRVVIDNFKSIDHIEIDFDKVGDSYTKIFVGINESGKSNILEALSYFKVPSKNVSFDNFCNQKFEDKDCCEIKFYLDLEETIFSSKGTTDEKGKRSTVDFKVLNTVKRVFLQKGKDVFSSEYKFEVNLEDKNTYIKEEKVTRGGYYGSTPSAKLILSKNKKELDGFQLLSETNIFDFFNRDNFIEEIKKMEPEVSLWQSSPEYMLSDINLYDFSRNINSNKPLKNIFQLCDYKDQKSIVDVISNVKNPKNRSKLTGKLNGEINKYISSVWNNKINIVIEITETGQLSFLIKDQGTENEYNRFYISERSQGAQQFLSLILSLSLEAENHQRKNELILIDEPEVHLHPSGIRDLGKELLKVGRENYVFMATHSPFIIDKNHKERHYIVKKDNQAITEIKRIKESDNIIDDEVLNEAFGINVYQDLLNPHSILVEGASDKILLKKAFSLMGKKDIGITNGHGTNIETLASKMNYDNISVLVIVDDDIDGRKYKEKIKKIGGAYNDDNVFTIRDIEGGIIDNGTIEDTLGKSYIESQFIEFYKAKYGVAPSGFSLTEELPVISQIKKYLTHEKKYSSWDMDDFKKRLSENFNPRKAALEKDHKLLKNLAEGIIKKLK